MKRRLPHIDHNQPALIPGPGGRLMAAETYKAECAEVTMAAVDALSIGHRALVHEFGVSRIWPHRNKPIAEVRQMLGVR